MQLLEESVLQDGAQLGRQGDPRITNARCPERSTRQIERAERSGGWAAEDSPSARSVAERPNGVPDSWWA
jgi:hypothetical protein